MRIIVALVLLAVTVAPAVAGERCARRKEYVILAPGVTLDELGNWQRGTGDATRNGTISRAAVERVVAIGPSATTEQMTACLDALISNEHGKAATRACTAHAKR